MTAQELQDALLNAIDSINEAREEVDESDDDTTLADLARDMASDFDEPITARSYKREMILTNDAGLVIRTADGAEFQLTIVQSRRGREPDDMDSDFDDSDCSPACPMG